MDTTQTQHSTQHGPECYRVVELNAGAWVVLDIRTGAQGRVWRTEREAVIDRSGILLRNLMHS